MMAMRELLATHRFLAAPLVGTRTGCPIRPAGWCSMPEFECSPLDLD